MRVLTPDITWFRTANKYVEHNSKDIGFFKEYDFVVGVFTIRKLVGNPNSPDK